MGNISLQPGEDAHTDNKSLVKALREVETLLNVVTRSHSTGSMLLHSEILLCELGYQWSDGQLRLLELHVLCSNEECTQNW